MVPNWVHGEYTRENPEIQAETLYLNYWKEHRGYQRLLLFPVVYCFFGFRCTVCAAVTQLIARCKNLYAKGLRNP